MSYDIDFIYVDNCADVLSEVQRRLSEPDPEPNEADDRRRRALVADLLSLHSTLKMEPHRKLGFAHGCWIGTEDGDSPFPDIHFGIRSAFVSVSYSADPEALRSIDALADVFRRHGFVGYDPQTESLWSSQSASERFAGTSSAVTRMLADQGETVIGPELAHRKRPWWKFW